MKNDPYGMIAYLTSGKSPTGNSLMAAGALPQPKVYKRRLAINHAGACQKAQCKECRCRCKGQLHGLDHMAYKVIEDQLFADKKALNQPVFEADIDAAIQVAIQAMRTP